MNIFDHYRQRYEAAKDEEFTLQEFLTTCRQDSQCLCQRG
ncbi:serine kinase family protein [Escherichia coli]|uniref:Serine kinase family protein n=1 Tax=Escherichia coli TaxID=562 RepID=A0A2X3K809_ECOLX|nr:serine kinase family protein [Escherichia coli]